MDANELYHYGVQGRSGRYPWGSGSRPRQRLEKPKGQSRVSGRIQERREKKILTKEEQQKKKELQAAKEAAEKKQAHDADKGRVLREGSATEVLKYKGELTNKELQDVVTRIQLESRLSDFSAKEIKSYMDKIDSVMKTVQTATNWAKIGTETYNTLAKIYNSTEEGSKNPLTIIGEKKKDDK